jgi:hypothetical protein
MNNFVETRERLQLIQIAVIALGSVRLQDHGELAGLIEALCRHHDLSVLTCISEPRHDLLCQLAPESYIPWRDEYLRSLGLADATIA